MTCPDCLRLLEENRRLRGEVEELKRRLAAYENPHTPPSRRPYPTRTRRPGSRRYPGRPAGHPGSTRIRRRPDEVVSPPRVERCGRCGSELGEPRAVSHRVVEEISNPSPRRVIDYLTYTYECPECGDHEESRHPDCPPTGFLGKNALVQATLLRYWERLPVRKVSEALAGTYGLTVTPATALDMTGRVAGWLRPEYASLLGRVRASPVVYVDETGLHLDGVRHWIWAFTCDSGTVYAIRRSRGKRVLGEVLGDSYPGVVVCDGWRSYPNYSDRIQRCWSHLLREARYLAEHVEEAEAMSEGLHALYRMVVSCTDRPPPPGFVEEARGELLRLVEGPWGSEECKRFAYKVLSGLDHWFTFLGVPGVEATNNRAERALRELVVQRKVWGGLRNGRGAGICEVVMSLLYTWRGEGRDLGEALGEALTRQWNKS